MTQPTAPAADSVLRLPADAALDDEAMRRLRRLHMGMSAEPAAALDPGLVPAALQSYRSGRVRGPYPLFVSRGEDGAFLVRPLPALLEETAPAARALRDNLRRLEAGVRDELENGSEPRLARAVLEAAGRDVTRALALPEAEAEALRTALGELVEAIPPDGSFLPLTEATALELLALAAESRCAAARGARWPELVELVALASRMLAADEEAREGRRPDSVAASLGALGGRYLDSGALAGLSRAGQRGRRLPDERRGALEAARDALGSFLGEPAPPRCATADAELEAPAGWTVEISADPCHRAIRSFDEEADRLAAALRAAHRIRLESQGDFDPARHEPWLEHLSWEAFDRDELALLPPVVALTTASALEGGGMALLSRLLLSGRPIQVLVTSDPEDLDENAVPAAYRFEPGFLGLAHREAFVQQASVARPETLLDGFRAAVAAPRAALHVVAGMPSATDGALDPWLGASAILEGRCEPQFRYDPEAGGSWARRLRLLDDPAPDQDWSMHTLRVRRPGGQEENLPVEFTAADSLLLSPRAADHFFPATGDAEAFEPLASWLALDAEPAALRLPFVWAADRTGTLRRLVVSRRLARATRDRLGFWRTLQELAGIRNEHVDAAARRAREESLTAAQEEWRQLEARHVEELARVRREAAEEAVDRLVAALFELEAGEIPPAAEPSSFAGRDVEELAASLLDVVRGANGYGPDAAASDGDERVDELAAELMALATDLAAPEAARTTVEEEEATP